MIKNNINNINNDEKIIIIGNQKVFFASWKEGIGNSGNLFYIIQIGSFNPGFFTFAECRAMVSGRGYGGVQ